MIKVLITNYFIGNGYNSTNKINEWLENVLEHYLIDCERRFVIYTDNNNSDIRKKFPDIIFEYIDPKYTQSKYFNLHIKYQFMFESYSKHNDNFNCDYLVFSQSNFRCAQNLKLSKFISPQHKMSLLYHPNWTGRNVIYKFANLYNNAKISENATINIKDKQIDDNFIYYQAGHIIIEPKFFLYLFGEINGKMLYDLYNNNNISWHDETYMNYMLNFVVKDRSIIHAVKYSTHNKDSGF